VTVPAWMTPLQQAVGSVSATDLTRFPAPPDAEHRSAVLMLMGESDGEPDVLLIERAHDMRSHAGQPAFPGGRVDDGDADVSATALREAEEETGLDPSGVEVVAVLPDLFIPPSGFVVTPVLGWWERPTPVYVKDPAEVASVHRVPIAELADPARRVRVRHPSGYVGPAFEVRGLLVWGFTGGLVDRLIHLGGWERSWSEGARTVPLPDDPDRPWPTAEREETPQ
jgi:8-oxo-dGTP pyrophosphatase MutT (NUDIX family)